MTVYILLEKDYQLTMVLSVHSTYDGAYLAREAIMNEGRMRVRPNRGGNLNENDWYIVAKDLLP